MRPLPPPESPAKAWYFAAFAAGLTCAAFVGGTLVRRQTDRQAHVALAPPLRLAQAQGLPDVIPASDRRSPARHPPTEAKRFRMAADTFADVYDLLRDHYVDTLPSETTLGRGAARAMVSALEDPGSVYLSPAERAVAAAEEGGHFAGIGAVTAIRPVHSPRGYTEQHLVVVAPVPGSSACAAGLRSGDRITHIDGRYILSDDPYLQPNKFAHPSVGGAAARGVGVVAARESLRAGDTGAVTLVIARPGVPKPFRLTVPRAAAPLPGVEARAVAEGSRPVLYLRVRGFVRGSESAVISALRSAPAAQTVVLDLRQNAGIGALETAEAEAAALGGGSTPFAVMVLSRERVALRLPATEGGASPRRRVAVLTDGGTAGLAECLASYLARGGAVLAGDAATFGDASRQTTYPLGDGSAFMLTTGRLQTPAGTSWAGGGLAPRLLLPQSLSTAQRIARAADAARVGTASAVIPAPRPARPARPAPRKATR